VLNIIFGDTDKAIYNTSVYFDNTYYDAWLHDEFAQKMIKGVDKAVVLSNNAVDSKVLGVIPVTKISGGLKTLLLIYNDHKKIFNASTCGDNCAKWILKIAKMSDEDITINLHHVMDFSDCEGFSAYIVNTDKQVGSYKEYLDEALRIEER
jgi:hypothetical protein